MGIPLWHQESSEKIPVPHWSKISINRCIEEGKKNSFTLLMSPLSKGSVTQCQERSSQPVIFPRGEVKVEWAPHLPSLVRHCPRSQLLFQPTQVTEVISIAKYFGGIWGKREGVGTHRSHHVDLKNQLQILLGGLWTLPRDPSMNTMRLLTCTYP